MRRFDQKVVLVTGGSSGIGFAAARAFIDEGARVVITGRDPGRLDAARISPVSYTHLTLPTSDLV